MVRYIDTIHSHKLETLLWSHTGKMSLLPQLDKMSCMRNKPSSKMFVDLFFSNLQENRQQMLQKTIHLWRSNTTKVFSEAIETYKNNCWTLVICKNTEIESAFYYLTQLHSPTCNEKPFVLPSAKQNTSSERQKLGQALCMLQWSSEQVSLVCTVLRWMYSNQ